MRFLCILLLGAVLVHGVRLSQEPDQLLEPVSLIATTPEVICTRNCDPNNKDCTYTAWSDYGPCWSVSDCGGPYFVNQTRQVAEPATGSGTPCTSQAMFQSRACNQQEIDALLASADFVSRCAVGCVQSAWVKGSCDVTQAQCPPRAQAPNTGRIEGRIISTRTILVQPQYGGALCGPNEKTEVCYFDCRYDCEWGPWSASGCELPCRPPEGAPGQNRQKYTRKVQYFQVNGGAACTGDSSKYEGSCLDMSNLPSCCPGCTEGPWGDWTSCSVTCGYGGSRRRTRVVTPPSEWYANPAICGSALPACGATEQEEECCSPPCVTDCNCGPWTPWSDCYSYESGDVQCGTGSQQRFRTCTPPQYGGAPCPEEYQEQTCVLPGCPVNCEVTPWSEWSACPQTCGVRLTKYRTRHITVQPENGGIPCPALREEIECPCTPCPVDCELSPWSIWGPCDAPCGPGKQQRTRDIIVVPRNGGRPCGIVVEERDCIVNVDGGYWEGGNWVPANRPCDVNCVVGPWGAWSGCTKSCTSETDGVYPGVRTRTRVVTIPPEYNGVPCPATEQKEWCATNCCPVDMTLTPWGDWSPCTATCGGGWQTRRRQIQEYPRCGGRILTDALFETQRCNEFCCNTGCQYHPWGGWSSCKNVDRAVVDRLVAARDYASLKTLMSAAPTISCPTQSGVSARFRDVRIENPCSRCLDTGAVRECTISCPVDCEMYGWGAWSHCDRECGWGAQIRRRSVKTPASNGGTPCPCEEDIRPCYAGPCCEACRLSDWNPWEACTASCGGGTQTRRRYVNISTEVCPELECMKAGLRETRSCNTQDCPAPCRMTPWSLWSACSSSCGLGFQYRTRSIEYYGDGHCEWDYEEIPCNLGRCPTPCVYTEWTAWTPCPVSCLPSGSDDVYYQHRAHYLISGDSDCVPMETQEKRCDPYPTECDRMCQVTAWGNYSECSSPYGWGERRRERSILVYPTGHEICPQLYQIDRCYHEPPPNNCTWSTWGDWSSCSASCKTATNIPSRYRERYLVSAPGTTDYTSAGGGTASSVTMDLNSCAATGGKVETERCGFLPFCPQDCVMSKWSKWSECAPPGVRHRTRHVVSGPLYGGAPCPVCVKETDQCTVRENELSPGECEVGKCLLEVKNELAQKIAAQSG